MAHFYGSIDGNRGEVTRLGSPQSGLRAVAASWEGCIRTTLYKDPASGWDMAKVELDQWQGNGVKRPVLLYHGRLDAFVEYEARGELVETA